MYPRKVSGYSGYRTDVVHRHFMLERVAHRDQQNAIPLYTGR